MTIGQQNIVKQAVRIVRFRMDTLIDHKEGFITESEYLKRTTAFMLYTEDKLTLRQLNKCFNL